MKTVFKEWIKDKRACIMLSLSLIFDIIYMIINARIVIAISNALGGKYYSMVMSKLLKSKNRAV